MRLHPFYFAPDEPAAAAAPAPPAAAAAGAVPTSTETAQSPAPTPAQMSGGGSEHGIPLPAPSGVPEAKNPSNLTDAPKAPKPPSAQSEAPAPAKGDAAAAAEATPSASPAEGSAAPNNDGSGAPQDAEPPSSPTPEQEALLALAASLGITDTDPAKIKEYITAREQQAAQLREAEYQRLIGERIRVAGDQAVANLLHPRVVQQLRALDTEGLFADVNFDVPGWQNTPIGQEAAKEYLAIQSEFLREPETQTHANLARENAQRIITEQAAKVKALHETYPTADFDLIQALHAHGADISLIEDISRRMDQAVRKHTATLNSAVQAAQARIRDLEGQIAGHAEALEKAVAEAYAEGEQSALEIVRAGRELPTTIGVGTAVQGAGTGRPKESPLTYRPNVPIPTL